MSVAETASPLAPLRLKRREERRLRAGHLWVYSNEVDTGATPLTGFAPGQPVRIEAHNGRPLGSGYVNPHSLICARLVSRDPDQVLDKSLLVHRLNVALSLRQRLYEQPCYRLCYGEADGLPGLIVDRYGDILAVQLTTAGMEAVREAVIAALEQVLRPQGILLRNDTEVRRLEGLETYVETLGEVPDPVVVSENGARFEVSLQSGQKTGWFYDQADNRGRLRRYAAGARVLDVFSYVGAWGVQAALAGASEVICVDSSREALERAAHNAVINGVGDRLQTRQGDAFEALKALREADERFDLVILDPPAFIKRRKDIEAGTEAYQRLNQLAIRLLGRDGFLVTASCSHHMQSGAFRQAVHRAARHVDRRLQILEWGQQAADHPRHPAIVETDYLKALYCRLVRD
ncbi:class I SAM-dependent rRNA methyltransferase [Thiohalobacter thiocyanaticus]|uniref:Class I SAM-dependent rRNA methyltransferase n=1 Tax=Thiohalobacter thiocyanaticus TaxID=585455 RepID=A0A426QKN7_9GAMM|nr:class I SAM-dependent rRNA methyltransferase [Thiohalobacter thiocyanaticus]RRQ22318.1 class I SAM-dependent rRNA methyltransferase [Thiohalobacter thiocyanaticus]